jgi:coatomer subunit beta'
LRLASQQVKEADKDTTDTVAKWKRLGDLALATGDLPLANQCAQASGDLAGLLLLHTASGNAEGVAALAAQAAQLGKTNVAFASRFVLGDVAGCVDLLVATGRVPEAAFFARTYLPSRMGELVALWKTDLAKVGTQRAARPTSAARFLSARELSLRYLLASGGKY